MAVLRIAAQANTVKILPALLAVAIVNNEGSSGKVELEYIGEDTIPGSSDGIELRNLDNEPSITDAAVLPTLRGYFSVLQNSDEDQVCHFKAKARCVFGSQLIALG
jgi:hypothetical protein